MATGTTSRPDPGVSGIVTGAIETISRAPEILVVALVFGGVLSVVPQPLDVLLQVAETTLIVLLAARAVGGRVEASPLVGYVSALVTVIAIVVLVVVGLVLLILPGLYLFVRLWLAPAAAVAGGNPFEALAESWKLMDGSMLAAVGFFLAVLAVAFGVSFVFLLTLGENPITGAVVGMVVGAPAGAGQAWLYFELAD